MLTTTINSNELATATGYLEAGDGVPVKTSLSVHIALGGDSLWLEIGRDDCAVCQVEPVPGNSVNELVAHLTQRAHSWGICSVGQQRMAHGVTYAWLNGLIRRR